MNNMNKILSVSLAFILLAAGCSNAEDATSDPSVNEAEENQENNEDEEKNDTSDQESNDQETEKENKESNDEGNDKQNTDEKEENPSLTKEQAKEVAVQAETSFNAVVNSTEGDTFKIKGYETKKDIVKELQSVMSRNLAQSLTDAFFVMRDGELYLEPKGGPLWFDQDQSFTLQQPGEQKYVIVQEHNSEMTGQVVMEYMIIHNGENWVLDQMNSKQESQAESKVTEEQAVELVRKQIGAQAENVKVEVDHIEGNRYVVQVYEVVEQENNTHTATKGWYYVDQDTGEVTNMMN